MQVRTATLPYLTMAPVVQMSVDEIIFINLWQYYMTKEIIKPLPNVMGRPNIVDGVLQLTY